jgi:hypothetical protein
VDASEVEALKSSTKNIISRKVLELTEIAMEIQLKTSYCSFVSVSGHVNWIEFSIRKSKYLYEEIVYPLGGEISSYIEFPSRDDSESLNCFLAEIDKAIMGAKKILDGEFED